MKVIDDGAVEVATQKVVAAFIARECLSLGIHIGFEDRESLLYRLDPVCRQQIEAEAQIDDCADYSRLADIRPPALKFSRPLEAPPRVCFPKVNTRAEPVVGIFASTEILSGKQRVCYSFIASVIAEDE